MTTEPPTCAPPPEHAHHEWHWLKPPMARVQPVRWAPMSFGGMWWFGSELLKAESVECRGWRYVAPCELPASEPA